MTNAITRSTGIPATAGGVFYGMAGGGYQGATDELDAVVQEAAEALARAYQMDVTIRFNSDRESGGAWLVTHEQDAIDANAEVGIGASVVTESSRRRWEQAAKRDDAMGLHDLARDWRDMLATMPAGELRIHAHIQAGSCDPGRLAELRALDGWNDYREGYHHGAADSVAEALARCLRFAPPARVKGT